MPLTDVHRHLPESVAWFGKNLGEKKRHGGKRPWTPKQGTHGHGGSGGEKQKPPQRSRRHQPTRIGH